MIKDEDENKDTLDDNTITEMNEEQNNTDTWLGLSEIIKFLKEKLTFDSK